MPNGGSIGHRLEGLTEESTEAEVDAYLSNPAYYPVGMFDDTFDGNGDPMQISPLFRQDLAGNRCEGLPVCKSDHILIREAKTPPHRHSRRQRQTAGSERLSSKFTVARRRNSRCPGRCTRA
jgi:hypothetical protein